ncbi:MAG: pyridoxal phosphate-dependent aminotransferase [Deltaproteobacteria bacterium]|nr:pyridoxal phosphate-dependent aminotransferase [Deltaproteobacteria bacterium]
MRNNIVHPGAGELTYEIRAIVEIADQLRALGVATRMENIGDPVSKGERLPAWLKQIVSSLALEDSSYAYCPSKGVLETREFLAERVNARGGIRIGPDDILFFNGLGDAIQKVYGLLRRESRVIGPSPTYSTHSSGEAAHAGQHPVCYRLDPERNWYPDLADLRLSVKYNPAISGILIINPDNPTGAVYPEHVLREMVDIAREFDLFIVADEIYANLVFDGQRTKQLSDVIGDVPALSMKGISKEVPWPGSRCGWIEVYNADKDATFARYVRSLADSKMVEVCSTTLPQKAIPQLLEHPEYQGYLDQRRRRYARHADIAYQLLGAVPGLRVNRTNGAFYMSVVFEEGVLDATQSLPIANAEVRGLVERITSADGVALDKRFVYYLLASTGICVVPLSSFWTPLMGFRLTLLEQDEAVFTETIRTIGASVTAYLRSSASPARRAPTTRPAA